MALKRTVVEELVNVIKFESNPDEIEEFERKVENATEKTIALGAALGALAFDSAKAINELSTNVIKKWEDNLVPIEFNLKRLSIITELDYCQHRSLKLFLVQKGQSSSSPVQ